MKPKILSDVSLSLAADVFGQSHPGQNLPDKKPRKKPRTKTPSN